MKKIILLLGILLAGNVLLAGCERKESKEVTRDEAVEYEEEITLMHIDADREEFQKFIEEAEEELQMKIHLLPSSVNADNRHAKISTILSSGDSSVDVIAVNDEMISEFKYQGYLEPLGDNVMPQEIMECYPHDYMQKIAMAEGKVYSVPYFMDIMMFWVNEKFLRTSNLESIDTLEDFNALIDGGYGYGSYGYGSAWETTYVYNDLSQFINMFGGDYEDWSDPYTREAVIFLHDIIKEKKVPADMMLDQYEQMEQKFIDGKYGSVFMYSGAMSIFLKAGIYGKDKIHGVMLPVFRKNTTNVATWQYVLNRASANKKAAEKFLAYAASREGSIAYASAMNRLPARLDIIEQENLNIPDIEIMREYIQNLELKARPLSYTPMEDIRNMGELFQRYVSDEITLDEFCDKAQEIVYK